MAATSAVRRVELAPEPAWALWTDLQRWPTFVEGFGHVAEKSGDWPREGAKIAWTSTPGGRGRVEEKVKRSEPGAAFETRVIEDALAGTQIVTFEIADDGRTRVELRLDYELAKLGPPLRGIADVLFIRRALNQALSRTLARFATEAAEEAAL
jgi:uncharacterized membrane protein